MLTKTSEFKESFKKLDQKQKEAVLQALRDALEEMRNDPWHTVIVNGWIFCYDHNDFRYAI